jgi:hypothetical protein
MVGIVDRLVLMTSPANLTYLYDALKKKPVAVPYLKHNIREFIKLIDSLMQKVKTTAPAEMIMMLVNHWTMTGGSQKTISPVRMTT